MRLQLINPGLESDQPLRTETKHAQPGVVLAPFVGDHAGVEQHPQVAAHGGCGATGCIGQFAGAHGPAAKELDDLATRGIRQGAEEFVDIHYHCAIVNESVNDCQAHRALIRTLTGTL